MLWKDFSKTFKDGDHAFLSPSQYSWLNYDDDKLVRVYINKLASARGSALHALAAGLIKMKVGLPDTQKTLNMYVNDAIKYKLHPEYKMFYSKFCYGTTDAIGLKDRILRVHDLKTGKSKASFQQLRIYASLFFLCYPGVKLTDVQTELRIYQNDDVLIEQPTVEDILPIMDKIERYSKVLERLEDEYDDGFDAYGSGTR